VRRYGDNDGQSPISETHVNGIGPRPNSARGFDAPARESIMSAMRIGVLLCLLLAGVAFCTQPVAPPHSASPNLSARGTTAFHKPIASLGGPAAYPETRLTSVFDTAGVRDSLVEQLNVTHWYASVPHPFLAKVLPGVSFVAAAHGSLYDAGYTLCAITGDKRLYTANDLNSLLRAEGFTCDSTELQTITKIAVLVAHFATPPPPQADEPDAGFEERFPPAVELGTQAFPGVEFRSFTREATEIPYGAGGAFDTKFTVDCSINGVGETSTVVFHGDIYGRNVLRRVRCTNRHGQNFQPGRDPEPYPAKHSK
jgi:hypothetical protein